MRILVTGATGLIGGAVARRLPAGGHEIVGLARSAASASRLAAEGHAVVRGDLSDPESIVSAARAADAVVHAASPGDQDNAAHDEIATRAILRALRGMGRRFLYTSGCFVYGATGEVPATEDRPPTPLDLVRWRKGLEGEILAAADDGVHPIVIRPAWVYGNRGGTVMMMVDGARRDGVARYIGDGRSRWSTVHADDLADLYALSLERAPARAIFNGSHGAATPLIEIARAASEAAGAGGRVESWPLAEARQSLGAFADAIACDQLISGDKAVRELGWHPSRPSIVDDLLSYASAAA